MSTIDAIRAIETGSRQKLREQYQQAIHNANIGAESDPEEIFGLLEALGISIDQFEADCKERDDRRPKVQLAAQLSMFQEQQEATQRDNAAENERFAALQSEHNATMGRLNARYHENERGIWRAGAARQFLMANVLPEVAKRQQELNDRRAPLVETFRLVKQGLRHLSTADAESLRQQLADMDREQEEINKAKLSA